MHGLYGVDYSVDSPDDTAAVLAVNQDYVDGCEQNVGDLLSHLGTADVARDSTRCGPPWATTSSTTSASATAPPSASSWSSSSPNGCGR